MVDFGDTARVIDKPKTGLVRLYGLKFALDDRRLVGFTRDISVLTDDEYPGARAPDKDQQVPPLFRIARQNYLAS